MSYRQRCLICKTLSFSVLTTLCSLLLTGVASAQETRARFEVIKVTDEIYVHRDNEHMNLFLVTDDGIVVVDPINPAAGSNLAWELQRMAPGKKLLAIVYSHYHADHAGGARPLLDVYGDDVPIVANKRTGELLADKNWKSVVAPTKLIDPPWSMQAGKLTLEMRHVGPNHSSDMLVAWVPEAKLVYVVDFIGNEGVGYRDLPGVWLPQYWESIDEVLEWPIEIATFGHGMPGNKKSIEDHAEYWRKLRILIRDAIANGVTEDEAVETIRMPEYKDWRSYEEWFPMNVRGVYRYEKEAAAE